MKKYNFLNSREVKKLKEILVNSFGYGLKKDYAYLINENERVFIVNKDISRINLQNLLVDRMGLYFAEYKNTQVRLSKEGAQLLVREAKENNQKVENLVELSKEELKAYFTGQDLEKGIGGENRLVIICYKDEVIGCAKYKDGKILNFLPKIHRGEVILS
ncbi:hypothetical protein COY27_03195 [Candidatus Woesearchaeota archaeon CG_4_10_14_0_2_um_filter_33_13]|nr:MAG: hypothetical protein COY27_03195 [Candidatus Woesearchaeota archaeon CG_4_10_14_0_2_um_filter_33_13]